MRINIASGPLYPIPAVAGGAMARVWEGLAKCFAAEGHEVCVIARTFPGQSDEEVVDGIRYIRWGGFDQSTNVFVDLAKDFMYAVGVLRYLPAGDILVINDFSIPLLAGLFNSKAGKVVVSANRFPKRQFGFYPRLKLIAAASTAVANAIRKQTPRVESKIKIIPNPLDTEIFQTRTNLDSTSNQSDVKILYVGRVHPEKGIDHLVAAAQYLMPTQNAVIEVVGPWEESSGGGGVDYLHDLKQRPGADKIAFCGPEFDPLRLADRMRSASLFCYPSIAEAGEAFGLAPVEAMASGLVPVVSNLDCFKDFIKQDINGFCFDHRAENPGLELARVISRALNDRCQLDLMARQAVQTAQRYSFSEIAKSFLDEFDRILSS